ncbi:MAG: HEAT repeat domain-containing protein [Kofleriaceae bacterium]
MPRAPELAFSLLLLAGACRSQASPAQGTRDDAALTQSPAAIDAASPRKVMTSEQVVRQHAGNDAVVQPWEGAKIAGFDLFWVSSKAQPDEPGTGAGVVVNGGKVLSGPDAMRAVIASGSQDARALATYASHLLARGAAPLVDGADVMAPPAHKALIKAPSIASGKLEFWSYQPQVGAPVLLHTQLDLASLAIVSTRAEKLASPAQDTVETARAKLAASAFDQKKGAEELGKLCADPRVPAILANALATHKVPDTRAAVAKAMVGCKDAASVKALITALGDAQVPVRKWAAESLGAIGDRSARPALEKLAKTEQEPDAQVSIARALDKLK